MSNTSRNNNYKYTKGFTIVELVIVIAIVAILAVILIPTFSSLVVKAKQSAIKENVRNRYTEYFIEYGDDSNFVDDVVIKHKEVDCVIFIDGQMIGEIYTLADAIKEIQNIFGNKEIKLVPSEKYKDVLIVKNSTDDNGYGDKIAGFSRVTSNESLNKEVNILLTYHSNDIFAEIIFMGQYDEEKQCFLGTDDLYEAAILTLVPHDNYYLIKTLVNNQVKYLYMDFGGEEKGETHVFIGDLNNPQEPQEEYLWDIQVGYEGAVIKTKLKYQEKDHYYLTYYQAEKDFFRCHFGIKNTIYINKPYVFLFD